MNRPERPGATDPIAQEVAQFAEGSHLGSRAAEIDRTASFPRAEFREMGARGWLGLHLPTSVGGRGYSLPQTALALYHLGFHGGTAFAKLSLQPEFSSVLLEHGSRELIDRYFRPLVSGELLIGNHVTEPSAGSDASALAMEASRRGDSYRLTGIKSQAAFATIADAAIVYVHVSGAPARQITAVLVPQDLPGITRRAIPDLGERWMGRGEVTYEDVVVPVAHRIGEEGKAFEYLQSELTRERLLLAAIYLGVARASWEETIEDVGQRVAFGRPLATQQAVAFPLAEDWARLDAAWLYTNSVLSRLGAGEEVGAESALAKWLSVEAALTAIDHAIQFHGGAGYSSSLAHERRWRDVRSGRIAHGPSEIMLRVASRRLWPPPARV
ncbi:MAG: acyl-CoA/acyl-ACP dehydrogenase [Thermoplasmata archaeon]|nr:acyl-CoA/acyl-ACP dehydrogenase [Thermoplasmata archaeon]